MVRVARGRSVLVRMLIGVAVLAVVAVLFARTLRETTSTPYVLPAAHLAGWELALEPLGPRGPVLALTAPRELPMGLFEQVFDRTMESMNPPPAYAVTVIRRSEYDNGIAAVLETDELLELARGAGLDAPALDPRCMAVQQGRDGGASDRTYYAIFELPALHAFRERVSRLVAERGGGAQALDPDALAPALFLAATGPGFRGWPVADRSAEQYCAAPIELAQPPSS